MACLSIIFENSSRFYFEGEKVRIKLEVNLENSANVNNITANFVGLGVCTRHEGKISETNSKVQTSKNAFEIYFDDVIPLFVAQSKEAATLPPGIQVFSFEYQLPHSLPTSVESASGFIRYSVHVNVDADDAVAKKSEHFTVVSKTDLNKDVAAHLPGVLWKPENQCFLQALFCKTGPVRAFLHIPKRGFVPGECLFINAEVCNFHRFPIEWVKASLIQILKFRGSKSSAEQRTVAEVTRGCVLPSETQTWRSESVLVPPIPPTSYPPRRIIQVKYLLSFQYKPSWQRKAIELKQRIFIGAVRLLECGPGQEQGQGEGERAYSSEFFNGSNLEPCVFGPHPVDDDGGKSSTFSPLYPKYVAA